MVLNGDLPQAHPFGLNSTLIPSLAPRPLVPALDNSVLFLPLVCGLCGLRIA